MAASPFDSALFRDLFHDDDAGKLFTDSAAVRAMLIVEGTLAKVQGELGLIPEDSAFFIHRSAMEVQIDPAGLSAQTGQDAVCVPALVNAFRKSMEAPEHAQYIHWGATSQDIIDTALVLRLRQLIAIFETRLTEIAATLGILAEAHANTPMLARTYGQAATLTSFGAVVADWGWPVFRAGLRLASIKQDLLSISLSGAAGTLNAMGPRGPDVRSALATALKLNDPGTSWHSTRDRMAEFAGWITLTAGALCKLGEDILLLTRSDTGEVALAANGGSSTMPQKTNPVAPSVLVALSRQITALNSAMQGAMGHREQRDGAAWMVEWMSLPQMCMALAKALSVGRDLAKGLTPNPDRMARNIDATGGLIHAEALSFALAAHMPRPEAQAAVKALCARARDTGTGLAELVRAEWPEHDVAVIFDTSAAMGEAPRQAETFANASKGLPFPPSGANLP
ncbi:MAG: class-II fumarase/aspartase family protein [Brevirhabdus sp.]